MIRKGQKITVDGGRKSVNATLVDIDYEANKIWVRLPTSTVIQMRMNPKTGRYEGVIAGIELSVDPDQN